MTLSRVEHALGMMRVYLVECAAHNDWSDNRAEELAQTIRARLRQKTDESGQQFSERGPRLARDLLRRATWFINENLDSKLKCDEIAKVVGLDPFTFGRGFKLATGITPHQYVIRCRIRRAVKLLAREDLKLADIALEVGCPEPLDHSVSKAPGDHTRRFPITPWFVINDSRKPLPV